LGDIPVARAGIRPQWSSGNKNVPELADKNVCATTTVRATEARPAATQFNFGVRVEVTSREDGMRPISDGASNQAQGLF
jgi:hypothetical protein